MKFFFPPLLIFLLTSSSFAERIQISSLIPDSLIQTASLNWLEFKRACQRMGFDFQEREGFDLPSIKYLVSLEKPITVKTLGEKRSLFVNIPWAKNNHPGIAEGRERKEKPEKRPVSPSSFWWIEDTSFLCGEKVGRLRIYPFLFDQRLNHFLYQPISIEAESPEGLSRLKGKSGKIFEENFFSRFPIWYKIKIDSAGIYQLTGEELKRAGMSLSLISPGGLRLFSIGDFLPPLSYPDSMREIPIYVYTGQDGKFDPDDYILFYGEGVSRWREKMNSYYEDIFSSYNCYWLTYSSEPGKRIRISPFEETDIIARPLTKAHFEKELLCPPRGGTLWLWDMLSRQRGVEKVSKAFSFSLPSADTLKKLSLRIFSANRFFIIKTFLNGDFLDSTFVESAPTPNGKVIEIDTSLPLPSTPSLTLELSSTRNEDVEVFVDWFEFTYLLKEEIAQPTFILNVDSVLRLNLFRFVIKETPIILDITNPYSAKFLEFSKKGDTIQFSVASETTLIYLSPFSKLRRVLEIKEKRDLSNSYLPNLSADYIIVAPKEFSRLARLFANYRQQNSALSATTALLEDIYDFYLFGLEEPYALKRFFKKKRPQYALLLGDGDYDYRNLLRPKKPQIPPYEYGTGFSYEVYERYPVALDAWYADFEDLLEPLYPDFILGRIPCQNEKEGIDYLEKIRFYEKNSGFDKVRFLFSADDEYLGDPYSPDPCGLDIHVRSCEALERELPNYFEVKKVYLMEYPLSQVRDKPRARKAFADEIRDGVLGVVYFGHGAGFRLAHEQLLNIEDVFKIKSGGQYPFGFFGSCGVGRFDDFEIGRYREAIAEDLIRNPDGFIATIASAKASSPLSNEQLCRTLLSNLFNEEGFGEAFFQAQGVDITYHLFGDPTLNFNFPKRSDFPIIKRDTLFPKKVCTYSCSLSSFKDRFFSTRAFYGKRFRKYTATVYYNQNPYTFSTNYLLPGFLISSQKGRINSNSFTLQIIPPIGIPLDTIGDENNYYWEIPNSSRLITLFFDPDSSYIFFLDSLAREAREGAVIDSEGPEITLLAEGRVLKDTVWLPKNFLLSGRLTDPSGIFLPPYRNYPRLYLNGEEIELSPFLKPEFNPNQLTFEIPISLSADLTELRSLAYDNLLNQGENKVFILTSLYPQLTVSQPLVYFKKNTLFFSFHLSYPAFVKIRIYTIAGRFVKDFSSFYPSGANFFSLPLSLPKGVYLYKLEAQSLSLNQKVSLYEKFLIP